MNIRWNALIQVCLGTLLPAQRPADGDVVINEFVYDNGPGPDRYEFVELYNATDQAIAMGGWKLAAESASGPIGSYVLPAVSVPPAGFLVLGSPLVGVPAGVISVTVVNPATMLSEDLWDDDTVSLTLRDGADTIVDTLIYEAWRGTFLSAAAEPLAEGEGIWGEHVSQAGSETSWSRRRDGYDNGDNGFDFRIVPITPGATNDLPEVDYAENYNSASAGSSVTGWGGTFEPPTVIDPTVVGTHNPSSIAPSPDGGNAAVFWSPLASGSHQMLLSDVGMDLTFEAWVYLEASAMQSGETETWSVGVGGSTDAGFFPPDPPDPSAGPGPHANGNTGVSWTYRRTSAGATLYLIDHGDGGWTAAGTAATGETILGQVAITSTNAGWQLLSLKVTGDDVLARLGDPLVAEFAAPVEPFDGGVYAGYSAVLNSPTTTVPRPLTMDNVAVTGTSSGEQHRLYLYDDATYNASNTSAEQVVLEVDRPTGVNRFGISRLGSRQTSEGRPTWFDNISSVYSNGTWWLWDGTGYQGGVYPAAGDRPSLPGFNDYARSLRLDAPGNRSYGYMTFWEDANYGGAKQEFYVYKNASYRGQTMMQSYTYLSWWWNDEVTSLKTRGSGRVRWVVSKNSNHQGTQLKLYDGEDRPDLAQQSFSNNISSVKLTWDYASSQWTTYGLACGGANGTPRIGYQGSPTIGSSSFAVAVTDAAGGAIAALAVGTSLAPAVPIGTEPCEALILPQLLLPVILTGTPGAPDAGSAVFPVPIPNNPGLVGVTAAFQWIVFDDTAPSWYGFATSEGGEVTIGS